MKIAVVCHYYPPHVGGLEIAVQNLVQSLVNADKDVTLVTCAHKGARAGVSDARGARVYRVRAWNFFDTHFNIPFPIPGIGLLTCVWREVQRADIVHVHDVFYITSWVAYLCATLQQKPLFLTQHVALVEHPSRVVMALQNCVYATWGKWIFRSASRIIVHNAVVRGFVAARANPKKVTELRNGIDRTLFRPARDVREKEEIRKHFNLPEKLLVLFVGRFVPKKGIDELFAARDDDYDLVFAGSGEIKKEWKDARDVHILGPLSQQELALLYRAADICVLPSRGELFTLALQEAAASGLPVVTTDEHAYQKYDLDRSGIALVEPTRGVLRASIKVIVNDEKKRTSMSRYSLEIAEHWFDHATNSAALVRVYDDPSSEGGFASGGELKRIVTTSWDDGHVLDIQLATLLKKYDIGGTFYISPEDCELPIEKRLQKEQVRMLAQDFEIGAHTVTHAYLPDVDSETAHREIAGSKEILEEWTGRPVASFCYPKGGYTKRDEELTKRAGFARARTVKRFALSCGDDPYALPTSVHTYDHYSDIWNLARFVHFNPITFARLYHQWDKQAIALFDEMLEKGGVFHLWGHSWEIDGNKDWARLEKVLLHIAHREGVRYVANVAV